MKSMVRRHSLSPWLRIMPSWSKSPIGQISSFICLICLFLFFLFNAYSGKNNIFFFVSWSTDPFETPMNEFLPVFAPLPSLHNAVLVRVRAALALCQVVVYMERQSVWTCVEIQWGNTNINLFLAIAFLQERTCPTERDIISRLNTVNWRHFISDRSQQTVTWQQVLGLWQWLEQRYDCFKPKFQQEYYEKTRSLEKSWIVNISCISIINWY